MKTDKRTFVFYLDWTDILNGQPDNIRLAVFDAIIEYVKNGNEPEKGTPVYLAFQFIKYQIDKDTEKYAEVCDKRANAGRKHKGNQYTKRNKTEQMEQVFQNGTNGTNGTDNDYEYEYDNDYDNNTTINSSDIRVSAEKSAKQKTPTEPKKTYGEYQNVTLTDSEVQKLHEQFGDNAAGMVEYLSAYKIEKNYKTKSDYLTIKRWVADAYTKQLKASQNGNTNNATSGRSIQERAARIAEYAFAANGL